MKLPHFIFTTHSSVEQKWFTRDTLHSFLPLTAKEPWPFAIFLPPSILSLFHFSQPLPCTHLFPNLSPCRTKQSSTATTVKTGISSSSGGHSGKKVLVVARRGVRLWKPALLWNQFSTSKCPLRKMIIFDNSLHESESTASLCALCPGCALLAIYSISHSHLPSRPKAAAGTNHWGQHQNSHPHIPQTTLCSYLQLPTFSTWLKPLLLTHSFSYTRLLLNANCFLMKTNHHAITL